MEKPKIYRKYNYVEGKLILTVDNKRFTTFNVKKLTKDQKEHFLYLGLSQWITDRCVEHRYNSNVLNTRFKELKKFLNSGKIHLPPKGL